MSLEAWRQRAFALCRKRGWSEKWEPRLAHHILEAAELSEALRGKGGDPVEEAGDLILTALAMIPESISLADVEERNVAKVAELMSKAPYQGEERFAPPDHPEKQEPPVAERPEVLRRITDHAWVGVYVNGKPSACYHGVESEDTACCEARSAHVVPEPAPPADEPGEKRITDHEYEPCHHDTRGNCERRARGECHHQDHGFYDCERPVAFHEGSRER